jgi:hypothetical protein
VPYAIQCVFLKKNLERVPQYLAPPIASNFNVPSADVLWRGTYQLEEFSADGSTPIRKVQIASGRRVFMEESLSGDGVFDHLVWYKGGLPVRGVRSLLGDGDFQVRETWRNGRLSAESIDATGDGVLDFGQTFGMIPTKVWTYHQFGKVATREYQMPDGTRVQDLSTKMNGIFDIRVVFRGQQIVGLTRAGVQLPIVSDNIRGITWIGVPAHAGSPDNSRPEGVQTIGGVQYYVFRYAGVQYAEVVQN